MRIRILAALGTGTVLALAGCSETEVTRSDAVSDTETIPDTVGEQADSETAEDDTDAVIAMVEDHIRTSYESRGVDVYRAEMVLTDSGDYAGEAEMIDPTTGEQVVLECTATGVPGGAENILCVDPRFPEG